MKISILICTYNGEKYIKEQLDSILNQTFLPDEIIISDDNSTDKTIKICENYKSKYKKINWKIYKNKINKGYKKNFLQSLKYTTGDYIFLCDQDDIWEKNKIEVMIGYMKKNLNISLLMSNVELYYMDNYVQKLWFKHFYLFPKLKKLKLKNNFLYTPRPGCTFCIKNKYKNINYDVFEYKYAHDLLIWQLAVLNNEAYLCPQKTIKFRRHGNNTSAIKKLDTNFRIEHLKERIELLNIYIDDINFISDYNRNKLKKELYFYKRRYNYFNNRNNIRGILYTVIKFYKFYTFGNFLKEILYYLSNKDGKGQ